MRFGAQLLGLRSDLCRKRTMFQWTMIGKSGIPLLPEITKPIQYKNGSKNRNATLCHDNLLVWLPGILSCHCCSATLLPVTQQVHYWCDRSERHSPWKLGLASGECAQHFCIRDRNPEQAWGRLRGITLRSGRTPFTTFTIMCRMLFSPVKQSK